ncbi:hypothetical protein BH24DEI1_BH24DEI1_17320 [soil metagenome]|jgi:2'-5' RNA ligase|nr:2'-5' RNA ligase family protein [Deinococcota bacterium]
MHALVSVLERRYYREVERLWDRLEGCCDLSQIRLTPLPHLSWQLAQGYDEEALLPALEALGAELEPTTVRTVGLGIFSGPAPVLYLPVIKDRALLERHARLWQALAPHGQGVSAHYHPDRWVPHITLAHGPVSAAQIVRAAEGLISEPFDWTLELDNLALVCQEGDEVGRLIRSFALG